MPDQNEATEPSEMVLLLLGMTLTSVFMARHLEKSGVIEEGSTAKDLRKHLDSFPERDEVIKRTMRYTIQMLEAEAEHFNKEGGNNQQKEDQKAINIEWLLEMAKSLAQGIGQGLPGAFKTQNEEISFSSSPLIDGPKSKS